MKQVSEIDWKQNYIRAGIIPYTEQNGILFFAFGLDCNIASLGDFGGHYEPSDNDLLDTAIREYREESLNVFGSITRDSLKNCYAFEGPETIEILLHVTPPFYQYTEIFNNIIKDHKQHEIQNIIWLSRRQLLNVIDSQEASFAGTKIYHMYNRIYDCLLKYRNYL